MDDDYFDENAPLTGEAKAQFQAIMRNAEICGVKDDADTVARIAEKLDRPMQDVYSVNGDPRELALGYWVLAARMREDCRTLLKIGWGIRAEV